MRRCLWPIKVTTYLWTGSFNSRCLSKGIEELHAPLGVCSSGNRYKLPSVFLKFDPSRLHWMWSQNAYYSPPMESWRLAILFARSRAQQFKSDRAFGGGYFCDKIVTTELLYGVMCLLYSPSGASRPRGSRTINTLRPRSSVVTITYCFFYSTLLINRLNWIDLIEKWSVLSCFDMKQDFILFLL